MSKKPAIIAIVAMFSAPAVASNLTASDSVDKPIVIADNKYSKNELTKFAEAVEKIEDMIENDRSKLKNAETTKQYRKVKKEHNKRRIKIVQEVGLTTKRFSKIMKDSQSNMGLLQRINKIRAKIGE